MALKLTSAESSTVDFGDIAELAGAQFLSIVITNRTLIAGTQGRRFVTQYDSFGGKCFQLNIDNTDEIGFAVYDGTNWRQCRTLSMNIAANRLYRIAARYRMSDQAMAIACNGVFPPFEINTSGSNVLPLGDSGAPVQIGRQTTPNTADALDGYFSECAIWKRFLSDVEMLEYTAGHITPAHMSAAGGILYAPMKSTRMPIELWRGRRPSYTQCQTQQENEIEAMEDKGTSRIYGLDQPRGPWRAPRPQTFAALNFAI